MIAFSRNGLIFDKNGKNKNIKVLTREDNRGDNEKILFGIDIYVIYWQSSVLCNENHSK